MTEHLRGGERGKKKRGTKLPRGELVLGLQVENWREKKPGATRVELGKAARERTRNICQGKNPGMAERERIRVGWQGEKTN